jgi:hypothetical protein
VLRRAPCEECEQVIKKTLSTDQQRAILDLPPLPPNARVEVTLRVVDGYDGSPSQGFTEHKREPSPRILGKGRILGDIMTAVVDPDDWDALR